MTLKRWYGYFQYLRFECDIPAAAVEMPRSLIVMLGPLGGEIDDTNPQ